MTMQVRMYDPGLTPRGILPVLGGSAVLRNSNVSTFSLNVHTENPIAARFTTGWHIALEDDSTQLLTGQPDKISVTSQNGVHDLVISGQSHLRWVRDMITLPTPSRPVDQQTDTANYKVKGTAGQVIYDMLRTHIGQTARDENRRPITITRGPDGAQTLVDSRFQNLLDETRAILGTLRLTTWMEGSQIHAGAIATRNLTRSVRLSEASAGLTGYTYELEAPTVTRVLVAGQGVGAARTMKLHTGNPNEWGVNVLQFQDRRDTDDADELEKAGTDTLTEGQEKASITLETTDTIGKRFARDFDLGDTVTVTLATGVQIQDIVQTADITWDEKGRQVKLQIGPTQEDLDAPAWVKRVHKLRTDLRRLQTV
ncbi:siphovirus ReqiPepy6 Gp37-like family protein [Brevibacterium sp. 91QC2O2]|nr:siphovirus ReqiPepy6 Gp37-like family protein [Brevibacterium sp. 91QC2O2]MCQ9367333.1 siphovirus ReqiPepy6 Gp37-like family protein [Brevibacterium sp. 91QC2O2]